MIRRAAPSLGVVVAVTFALAGCAQPAAEPTAWQQSVQTVAEQASAGDYASALASLGTLEADVTARRDAGEITAAEADAILARIATVRGDLTSLTPAPSATPTPTEEPTEPEETTEPEPSETAEPDPTPTPTAEPTPDDPEEGVGGEEETPSNGNGNKGPGGGGPGAKDDKNPGNGASPDPGKKDG